MITLSQKKEKRKNKNSMYSRQSDKSLMCAPTPIGFSIG
jgi:hypothetical protein